MDEKLANFVADFADLRYDFDLRFSWYILIWPFAHMESPVASWAIASMATVQPCFAFEVKVLRLQPK